MASGILRIEAKKGKWVRLPDLRANTIMFEAGDFDLAESPEGSLHFHIDRSDGVFCLPLAAPGAFSNLSNYWLRADSPIVAIWQT
jgi:hypothetical protein